MIQQETLEEDLLGLGVRIRGFSAVSKFSLDSQNIVQLPQKQFNLSPLSGVRSLGCSPAWISGSSHCWKLAMSLHLWRAEELP